MKEGGREGGREGEEAGRLTAARKQAGRGGGEVERRNPNFPPPRRLRPSASASATPRPSPALRNKFNFVGGDVGVGHFLGHRRRTRRHFLSFAVAAYWNLEGAGKGADRRGRREREREREGGRERGQGAPDGVKRALNHDQSASKLSAAAVAVAAAAAAT